MPAAALLTHRSAAAGGPESSLQHHTSGDAPPLLAPATMLSILTRRPLQVQVAYIPSDAARQRLAPQGLTHPVAAACTPLSKVHSLSPLHGLCPENASVALHAFVVAWRIRFYSSATPGTTLQPAGLLPFWQRQQCCTQLPCIQPYTDKDRMPPRTLPKPLPRLHNLPCIPGM
jgi:hypothetical protein